MAVFRHTKELPPEARGGVVAIGNFDGVHAGHRAVLGEAEARAAALGCGTAALTFEPHPRQLFQPDKPPFRLTSFRTKVRALEAERLDHLFVLHFDWDFARIAAEAFVTDILVADLGVRHVVVGENFRFGHKRAGDSALLAQLGAAHGFGVSALPPVRDDDGEVISSSRVRQALKDGCPRVAARLLGHPWEVEARVEPGAKRGRTIGFPTANLGLGELLEPAHGIYAVRAGVDRGPATQWWDAVAYVGRRPVVQGETVLLEVHIFDASPELYGEHLRVRLIERIRGDRDFESLEAMRHQVTEDCAEARTILAAEAGSRALAG